MKNSFLRSYCAYLCVVTLVLCCAAHLQAQLQWQSTGGPLGASILSFTTQQSTVYAGTSSGLFRSSDNGASWSPIGKTIAGRPISFLASNANSLFAISYGSLYRSDDNGVTWVSVQMPNGGSSVNTIAVNGNVLYVGSSYGSIFRSDDGGLSWLETYRAGLDTIQNSGGSGISIYYNSITAIAVNGSSVVAVGSRKGLLLRSQNRGSSWSASSPSALFFVSSGYSLATTIAQIDSTAIVLGTSSGFLRSVDNGITWQSSNSQIRVNSILKQNTQTLLAATSLGVLRSSNGGASWTSYGNTLTSRSVTSLGVIGEQLLAGLGNDGGVVVSTDNAQTWSPSNSGLVASSVSALLVSNSSLFALSNGNVLRSGDNGATWTNLFTEGSSVGAQSIIARGSNLFLAASAGILRSADNGQTWTVSGSGFLNSYSAVLSNSENALYAANYNSVYQSSNGTNWTQIARFDSLYYNITDVLANGSVITVAAYDRILRSTDNGTTWQNVWQRSTTGNFSYSAVRSLALSGTTMFAGLSSGIMRSTNNGATWVRTGLENQDIQKIVVSGSTIFAGTYSGSVFYSTDNGTTWISSDIPSRFAAISALAVSGSTVYAGVSGSGVFRAPTTPVASNSSCLTTLTTSDGAFRDRTTTGIEYSNNVDCRWLIKPTNNGRIVLSFSRFATEQNYDYVTVYDGETTSSPQIGRFTGNSLPSSLVARSGAMLVRFTTDSTIAASGWSASYSVIPNPTQAFSPPSITFPANNSLVSADYYLQLGVQLNAEANVGDFLRYQIATDSTFTNIAAQFDIIVSRFYPNQSSYTTSYYLGAGTRYFWRVGHTADTTLPARWSALSSFRTPSPSCSGTTTFTSNAGSFTDRSDSSANYSNNLSCSWLIQPANGGRITLSFSRFSTESCCDAVTVYDGATTSSRILGTFRGTTIPTALTSSSGVMLVRFTTDGSAVSSGWSASYTAGGATPGDTTRRELRIPSASVPVGTFSVPVNVSGITGQNVLSCQMAIGFDSTMIRLTGVSVAGTLADSSVVTVNSSVPGRLTFTLFRATPFTGNGALLNLLGTTRASSGQTAISVASATFNEGSPSVSAVGGTITLGGFLCGDVSRNGLVTGLDASLVAEHSVGSRRLTGDSLRAADVSGNRQVTAYDAALIAQYSVGLISSFPNGCPPLTTALAALSKAIQNSSSLTADEPVTIAIQEPIEQRANRYTIPLRLANTRSADIRAYSFAVRFDPAVVNISGASLDETLSAGGTMVMNSTEPGILRGVYFNTSGFSESGILLNLLADIRSSGRSSVTLENMMFNEGTPSALTRNGSIGLQATAVHSQHSATAGLSLSVFPTPATDVVNFTVSLTNSLSATLVLSTMLGQEVARIHDGVLSSGEHRFTWNAQNMPNGVYVASVQSGGIRLNSAMVQIVR